VPAWFASPDRWSGYGGIERGHEQGAPLRHHQPSGVRRDRYCQHGCRRIEDYRHVFIDCRTARPLWCVHFGAWKRILLDVPGRKEALFGIDLALRQSFRKSTRGAHILWTIVSSIMFHTL
jgi:hypothetical protein